MIHKVSLVSVLLFCMLGSLSYAALSESRISDAEYRQYIETSSTFMAAEKELDYVYKDLMSVLSTSGKESQKATQRLWIKTRDEEVFKSGKKGSPAYIEALVKITNTRIVQLRNERPNLPTGARYSESHQTISEGISEEPRISNAEYSQYIKMSNDLKMATKELDYVYQEWTNGLPKDRRGILIQFKSEWLIARDKEAFKSGAKGSPAYIEALVKITKRRIAQIRNELSLPKNMKSFMPISASIAYASTNNVYASEGGNVSTILWWLIFFGFLTILLAGITNKVVIFYDMSDLILSFSPWIVLLLFGFIASTFNEGFIKSATIWVFCYIIPVLIVIASIAMSIKYNRNIIVGIIVGPFKLLFSLLGIMAFVNYLHSWFDDKRSLKNFIVAGIIFAITGWLTKKLLNGEQVYLAKGWIIPEPGDGDNLENTGIG